MVVNGLIADSVWIPIFYVLMPYKDEDLYKKAFQMIDDALGHAFSWPQDLSVMMDFEKAERKAWLYVHPTHKLEGCMFHFDGGLWKYVHKNGMSIMYNSDSDLGKIFKGIVWMTFSLPLVLVERLEEAKKCYWKAHCLGDSQSIALFKLAR